MAWEWNRRTGVADPVVEAVLESKLFGAYSVKQEQCVPISAAGPL